MVCSNVSSLPPRYNKTIADSDVGQTFLSAGSGDFPVPGFRVKLSALVREVGKLRNRQARKPALQFGQHTFQAGFSFAATRLGIYNIQTHG